MLVNLNDVLKPAREYHYGVGLFNITQQEFSFIYRWEMNCRSEPKCSKEFHKQKRKHLFACWDCIIIIKREHIVRKNDD